MVKTASLCVASIWHNTRMWRTDSLTDGRLCRSTYSTCKASFPERCKTSNKHVTEKTSLYQITDVHQSVRWENNGNGTSTEIIVTVVAESPSDPTDTIAASHLEHRMYKQQHTLTLQEASGKYSACVLRQRKSYLFTDIKVFINIRRNRNKSDLLAVKISRRSASAEFEELFKCSVRIKDTISICVTQIPVDIKNHKCKVNKYNYIIARPKSSWPGLICSTHQHYHRQWLPNTEWSNSRERHIVRERKR